MLKVYRLNFDDEKFADVRQVRNNVFVVEQGVSQSDEHDDFESSARHYLIKKNDVSCGVARWRNTDKGVKLERFAVLAKFRGSGVGKRLVEEVLKDVLPMNQKIYLHAQIQTVDFYQKLSFEKDGEIFEEAGIKHYKMTFIP